MRSSAEKAPLRPPGWRAPGPAPAGPRGRSELVPRDGEDLSYLSGDWRIFQRREGHRWSLDDLVTAWYAAEQDPEEPERLLDMGCGIGSVLLMLAWRFPGASCVGVEAQAVSVGLARRSIAYNGVEERVSVRLEDLRELATAQEEQEYQLITGTPPYIPLGKGTVSERTQCGPCRFEMRGGIEEYCTAAGRVLARDGVFVFCQGAGQDARVEQAVRAAGLCLSRSREVIPRGGRGALFGVYAARRVSAGHVREPALVVRDAGGVRTAEYGQVRRDMGLPP